MPEIWLALTQFDFRLTFGVAIAMGVTPARLVTSGFYRVHLWVLMGLNTFAALAVYANREMYSRMNADWRLVLAMAISAAAVSYAGSVIWLYEQKRAGGYALYLVAMIGLVAAALATPWSEAVNATQLALGFCDLVAGGMLLGATLSAMFLGHWYLNTPSMELVPLKRLVALMIVAILARSLLAVAGLSIYASGETALPMAFWIFIGLRWLSGLLGTLALAVLAWQTLKIPNTQSATGILYAGVICAFIGELTAQLLSVGRLYPL
jgi:hypothetical protein